MSRKIKIPLIYPYEKIKTELIYPLFFIKKSYKLIEMKRDLLHALNSWKTDPIRKPLILRGARQVGKSWLVREFAKQFAYFVEINFERDENAKRFFEGDLHVPSILEKLSLYTGRKIETGKTLLFLDEIQECEAALKTLRYFKEELPDLHVIAAGSLIDFALEKLGVPVGRIQFLYLYPLSFGEFLLANDREDIRHHIHSKQVDPVIHNKILDLLHTYMWLGGMPAVVNVWLDHKDATVCQRLQDEIIEAYRQDFHKYARKRQIEFVSKVFDAIPAQLGKKFKYSNVDQDLRSYVINQALHLLESAGIAYRSYHSSGQGLPLGANKDEKKFKVFFFDIGLAQRLMGLKIKEWMVTPLPLNIMHVGAMAEQIVAQEYITAMSAHSRPELYYWHRENKGSNAEVDFLFVKDTIIVPVEVKSSPKGGMKSMWFFLETHPHSKYGLKISTGNFSATNNIEEIPLYGLEAWVKASP